MSYRLAVLMPLIWANFARADDEKAAAKPMPTVAIQPEPLTVKPGDALSDRALVRRPAALKGLVSWSLETRRHRGQLSATALRPDGKLLATGGLDGTVRLWDVETGKLVRALIGHNSYVYGLDFSPDGTALASAGSFDATVRLWDVRSGMPLRVLKDSPTYLVQVAWSPDGKSILAAGGESGTMSRWNAANGNYQTKFEFGKPVQAITWSLDSRCAAVVVTKLPLQIWDAESGNKVKMKLGTEASDFRCAAYSPDGKTLAAGTGVSTILYDADTGTENAKLDGQAQAVAWSSDGKTLATFDAVGAAVKLWDMPEGRMVKSIPATINQMHFTPEDKFLVVADYAKFAVFNIGDRSAVRNVEIAATVAPMWYSGKPLLTGIGTTKISLWDQTTGKLTREMKAESGAATAVAWSSDGKTLATAGSDKVVRLWDWTTGKLLRSYEAHTAPLTCVAFSPDGRLVASGGYDKQAQVWDAASGKTLHSFGGFQDYVTSVAWAPGSSGVLAVGSYDRRVRLYNAKTGTPGKVLEDVGEVTSLTWSPNGQIVVSGHFDHRVRFWQASTGKILHSLENAGSPPQVSALAWSPNDTLLASGRGNHTMQLWNVKTAALVKSLPTMAAVQRVAWSADSKTVVCSSADRTARFFDSPGGELRGVLLAEDEQIVAVAADGHYRADGAGTELIVVAQLDKGQEMMTPTAFGTKFKWKNTPTQVKLPTK
ncbi:MAG: eIF2A-related protein [Gemmataceae bacterium]